MIRHKLPELPYSINALEPYISAQTLEHHYGNHHAAYVDRLNEIVEGSSFEQASLDEIVVRAGGELFANAAQVWNHNFYWKCLSPDGGGEPNGALGSAIGASFRDFTGFREAFTTAAESNFGSGWTWLVKTADGKLEIVNSDDAGNPITDGYRPLLACDVWEHAYYLDHRGDRAAYLDAFWELVDWEFVANNHGDGPEVFASAPVGPGVEDTVLWFPDVAAPGRR